MRERSAVDKRFCTVPDACGFQWSMPNIVGGFVVACLTAGLAIHQSVIANPNVDDRLTQATILFALTLGFELLTLRTTKFSTDSAAHTDNLAPELMWAEMT